MISEKSDRAIALLIDHLSWDLLTEFDSELSLSHPDDCLKLYQKVIIDYVNQHFGIHAQDFVRKALSRLSNLDRKDWATQIRSDLKENYTDRRSLWS